MYLQADYQTSDDKIQRPLVCPLAKSQSLHKRTLDHYPRDSLGLWATASSMTYRARVLRFIFYSMAVDPAHWKELSGDAERLPIYIGWARLPTVQIGVVVV